MSATVGELTKSAPFWKRLWWAVCAHWNGDHKHRVVCGEISIDGYPAEHKYWWGQ